MQAPVSDAGAIVWASSLHTVCAQGMVEVAKELLQYCEQNRGLQQQRDGLPLLAWAFESPNRATHVALIDCFRRCSTQNRNGLNAGGWAAIHLAAKAADAELVKLLVECGVDAWRLGGAGNSGRGQTVFHVLAAVGDGERDAARSIARYLIKTLQPSAEVLCLLTDYPTHPHKVSAIGLSLLNRDGQMARLLAAAGGRLQPDELDNDEIDQTILVNFLVGYPGLAELLQEEEDFINIPHIAVSGEHTPQHLQLLSKCLASKHILTPIPTLAYTHPITSLTPLYKTPFHLAIQNGYDEAVRMLLGVPAVKEQIKADQMDERRALIFALHFGRRSTAELLLYYGPTSPLQILESVRGQLDAGDGLLLQIEVSD